MTLDQSEVKACRDELRALTNRDDLNAYARRALEAIDRRLVEISESCRPGVQSKPELSGLIARLVVEQDPSILSPRLGGRLIAVEKAFSAERPNNSFKPKPLRGSA